MSIGVSTTHLKNTTPSSIFYQASSQFKFLVMTEINIFFYNSFLSLNISVFSLFLIQKLQLPHTHTHSEKSHPIFHSNAPLKSEILWSPPIFVNLLGGSIPPTESGEEAQHEVDLNLKIMSIIILPVPCISESFIEIKIKLNFYFLISLGWLKRFYEGL